MTNTGKMTMNMKPTTRTARKTKDEELKVQATEMRKNAMSLRKIGKALGISHEKARKLINEGLEELKKDTLANLEEYRSIQVARQEEIIEAHRHAAIDPDNDKSHASAAVVHRSEAFIAKLMGTEQPIQTENKTEVSGISQGPSVIIEMTEPPETPEPVDNEEVKDGNSDQSA